MTEEQKKHALEIGHRIKALRLEKGFKHADVAVRVGKTPNAVSQWETGRSRPGRDVVEKLADALDTTVAWIWQGDGHRKVARVLSPGIMKAVDMLAEVEPEDEVTVLSFLMTITKRSKKES